MAEAKIKLGNLKRKTLEKSYAPEGAGYERARDEFKRTRNKFEQLQ